MEGLYRYEARDRYDRSVEGELPAASQADALDRITRLGLRVVDVRLDVRGSAALLLQRDFDLRALVTLYSSLAERVSAAGDLSAGLRDVLEFIDDVRLRAAVSVWIAADRDGMRTSEAMRLAEFPVRHVAVIASLEKVGEIERAFRQLAGECQRDYDIHSGLRRIVRQPAIYGVIGLLAYWGALAFLVAPVMDQVGRLGTKGFDGQPPFVQFVAGFSHWAHDHLVLWTLLCIGLAVGVIGFVRSPYGARCADWLPIWRKLTERADMASLWGAYAVLYSAGQPVEQAARLLADAGRRPQSREWFLALATSLRGGYTLEQAVQRAEFPRYVVSAIGQAVAQHTGIAEALERFAAARTADVVDLLDKLSVRVDLLLKIAMGLLIVGLIAVMNLPLFIAVNHMR